MLDEKNYFFHEIDYNFYTLKITKDLDGMGIRNIIVVTCHQLLDRAEIVKKIH